MLETPRCPPHWSLIHSSSTRFRNAHRRCCSSVHHLKPSLRVTVTLKDFGQRPINGASFLVDRTRSKQFFHTSQNRPSFCAFYWVTTFSSAKRVSGWPKERNLGGVTGELRRLGLTRQTSAASSHRQEGALQLCKKLVWWR